MECWPVSSRAKDRGEDVDLIDHSDSEAPIKPDEGCDSSQAFWQSNLASLKEYIESMED